MALNLLSGAIGLLGARAERRRQNKLARQLAENAKIVSGQLTQLSQPLLNQMNIGLGNMGNLVYGYMGGKVGKKSSLIESQRQQSLANIGRQKQAGLAANAFNWAGSGNVGRARGGALRIGESAQSAANQANLQSAIGQENYMNTNLQNYMNSLSGLTSMGMQGLQPAMQALGVLQQGTAASVGMKSQASSNFANELGTLVGQYIPDTTQDMLNQQYQDILRQIMGSLGTTATTKANKNTKKSDISLTMNPIGKTQADVMRKLFGL